MVILAPFMQRVIYGINILVTKYHDAFTGKCHLYLGNINLYLRRVYIKRGKEESPKQISDTKWVTGKMAKFCVTEDAFISVSGPTKMDSKKNVNLKK